MEIWIVNMLGIEPNIISWLMLTFVATTSSIAHLPQIIKLIRTKSSNDISLASWTIWVIQFVLMTVYAVVYTSDIVLCISYSIEMILCVLSWALIFKYKGKAKIF